LAIEMNSELARRQRMHQTTREEIMEIARQQIAKDGNAGLSLHGIARQMGLTAPALYRYFKGRDDLVTALVEAAYISLGESLAGAVAGCGTCDYAGQALALARGHRTWALTHASDYGLTLGASLPVDDRATEEIVRAIQRNMDLIVEVAASALAAGQLQPAPIYAQPPDDLQAELDAWERSRGQDVPTQALHVAVVIWTRIRGLVSLELQEHIQPLIGDPEALFEAELHELIERMGFATGTEPGAAG
jgi:AcrR family transcriptional regulator